MPKIFGISRKSKVKSQKSKVKSQTLLTSENGPKLSRLFFAFDFYLLILPKVSKISTFVENVKNIAEFLTFDGIC